MTGRVLRETAVTVGVTLVLLFVGAGLLSLGSVPWDEAFLRQGPAGLLALLGVPVLGWVILLLAAQLLVRRRSSALKLLVGGVVTIAIAGFTVAFWSALALTQGGFATLLIAVAAVHSLLFAVAGLLALAVTHLLVFRTKPAAVRGAVA